MASFKLTRDLLLESYDEGVIDDDEFLLLYDQNRSKNPEFPYKHIGEFDLEDMDDFECMAEFRCRKSDIEMLGELLRLPQKFVCPQGSVCSGTEGLCICLKRLAYPCRYSDLIYRFGKPPPVLSMTYNEVVQFIYREHGHRVTEWNHAILSPANLQIYAAAVHEKGGPLENCFGFIDGTVRPICRPKKLQRTMYNGHKRLHAMKFQSVSLPNGLIAHLYGPVEGKRHDASMLVESGLLANLEEYAVSETGQPMCVYGDPAYPLRPQLQAPFRGAVLTDDMKRFNTAMSSVRVSVEWLFGDVVNQFKFVDFKKNLKVALSPIGKIYITSAVLNNALICMYGNNTSTFFGINPPTVHEYFQ